MPQDTETCIMCQSRSESCTFIQSPQRRKRRRVDNDEKGPGSKAEYVEQKSIGSEGFANIVSQVSGI
jgi:hypothetical protein